MVQLEFIIMPIGHVQLSWCYGHCLRHMHSPIFSLNHWSWLVSTVEIVHRHSPHFLFDCWVAVPDYHTVGIFQGVWFWGGVILTINFFNRFNFVNSHLCPLWTVHSSFFTSLIFIVCRLSTEFVEIGPLKSIPLQSWYAKK